MTKHKSTKRALLLSGLALFACISMLVGSTFAWFTDSVTSKNNIIKSGNLDVELYYQVEGQTDWAKVDANTNVFMKDALWEPGHTEVVKLKVVNEGTLALKYQLGVNVDSEIGSVNVNGKEFLLSDYIKYGIVEGAQTYTRDAAVAAVDTAATALKTPYNKASALKAGEEAIVTMVVYMPTTVGNEANHAKDAIQPIINLGINLFATQYTYEEDSFGPDYDKASPWAGYVDTEWYNDTDTEFVLTAAEELAGLAAIVNGTAVAPTTTYAAREVATIKDNFKGKTIKLGGNIDLRNQPWTPIGDNANPFLGNFDGQGYTVSNLFVSNEGWAGLIGHAGKAAGCTVKNVTIDGATILSNRMAGAVVGQIYGSIDNCHVKNATIIAVPNAVGDSFDNGDKVGGIVGWLGDNGNNRTLTNCSATNVELGAYRDVGGIAGYVASSTTVKDNAVDGITITVDQITNHYGDKDVNAGYIYGRANGTITTENNTSADSKVDSTYSKNGLTLKADGEGNVKLYLVPETYAADTLTVPEGVTAIGNYAFAYNTKVETVVLASTVRDLGRGFDSSTVKKVVLNEGLEIISSRAFRSTTALEEVVISSTVKEIADNAFQKSAINEIVIPANVKTVGETAFGSSLIETVTFEGDIDIQGYAFRGCTKLRTVNLFGEDVKFVPSTLNGRNSMWFCNGESNNPNTSNITFAVRSEEIKERVLTAMGAERNNTPVIVFEAVESAAELEAAVAAGKTNIYLSDGEYNVANCGGKTLTISGTKNAILKPMNEGEGGADYGFDGSTVTFNGITVDTTANTGSYKGYARCKAIFNDCAFVGGGFTTFQDTTFNNCTFEIAGYIWTWGANAINFDACTFIGDSRTILAHGSASTVITIKDCDFAATTKGHTGAGDWTAVVEIDPIGTNTYTINFKGENTLSENYPGWTRVKDGSTGHVITGLN